MKMMAELFFCEKYIGKVFFITEVNTFFNWFYNISVVVLERL